MEETIKKGIEEFGDKIRNVRIRYSSQGIHDTQIYFTKSFIKTYTQNILKAQNKELEEKIKVVNSLLYNLSDEMRGEIRGYEKLIKENNKIINNL